MARTRQGQVGRICGCTFCDCPQDLRLKRAKRSTVCWYCDIGFHPGSPRDVPNTGHPPVAPKSRQREQSERA